MNEFISLEEIIIDKIKEFKTSRAYREMIEGEKYYNADLEDKLYHSFFKQIVDEKVDYLFTNNYSLTADNQNNLINIQKILGNQFNLLLKRLAKECSKKGKAWLHVYYDDQEQIKMRMIKAEEVIPLYNTENEEELEGIIRFYNEEVYIHKEKKTLTRVEYWTREDVNFYILEDEHKLILDSEKYLDEDYEGHYRKGNRAYTYPEIPFILFRNNEEERNDLIHIKPLIDSYNKNRLHLDTLLDEVREHLYLLKGYGGADKKEFIEDLKKYGLVLLDDEGDLKYLTPNIDVNALEIHINKLKKDIFTIGQSTDFTDENNFNQSGIALKIKFRNLDLKANHIELYFKEAFQHLMKFLLIEDQNIEIHFTRQVLVNELELIQAIKESKATGIVSDETLMSKHPYITNILQEKEKVKREREEKFKMYDFTTKEESLNE